MDTCSHARRRTSVQICIVNIFNILCTEHVKMRIIIRSYSQCVYMYVVICRYVAFITDCNTLYTLQHTATHCNTLQHTAAHHTILQHTAPHCNTLQHIASNCNTLQRAATHCNVLQHTATCCNTLRHAATHCMHMCV